MKPDEFFKIMEDIIDNIREAENKFSRGEYQSAAYYAQTARCLSGDLEKAAKKAARRAKNERNE